MPNWCTNRLLVEDTPENLNKIRDLVKGTNTSFSLERIVPKPIAPTPEIGWNTWASKNWGTKWDVEAQLINEEGYLLYSFDSAWGPPDEAVRRLSELYPMATYKLTYAEEGSGFAGVSMIFSGVIEDKRYEDFNSCEYLDILDRLGLGENFEENET